MQWKSNYACNSGLGKEREVHVCRQKLNMQPNKQTKEEGKSQHISPNQSLKISERMKSEIKKIKMKKFTLRKWIWGGRTRWKREDALFLHTKKCASQSTSSSFSSILKHHLRLSYFLCFEWKRFAGEVTSSTQHTFYLEVWIRGASWTHDLEKKSATNLNVFSSFFFNF